MAGERSRVTGRARKVLYLDTAPSAGGSVISLYELLRNLDRTHYDPVVVAYTAHAYVDRFRALGLDVIVWDKHGARDHRPVWVRQASESKLIQGLRRQLWAASMYHAAGFALMLAARVWPLATALRRVIKQRGIDLLHTNIRVGHYREGIISAKLAGIPCVSHIRDFERLNAFDRRLARMVDAFIYI